MSETISLPEAANRLGISRGTAYTLYREGKFPAPVLRIGRLLRVPERPFRRLLEEGTVEARGGGAESPLTRGAGGRPQS